MKISEIVLETASAGSTGAGSVAAVNVPLGGMRKRPNPSIYAKKKTKEDVPPGREDQVKALKGKVDNPYAVSWASYNKSKKKKSKKSK